MSRFLQSLRMFFHYLPRYVTVIFLCYGPWTLVIRYLAAEGVLPGDGADHASGLFDVLFMPFANGVIAWLNHELSSGREPTLQGGFSLVVSRWKDLITAYISVCFIMLGWLAVAVVPSGLIMLLLGEQSLTWLIPGAVAAIIYVMARYVFLDFYIVLRGLPGFVARRSCAELTVGLMPQIVFTVMLMAAPLSLAEFGYEQAGNMLSAESGITSQFWIGLFSLLSPLLYVVPQIYFYLMYRDLTHERTFTDKTTP